MRQYVAKHVEQMQCSTTMEPQISENQCPVDCVVWPVMLDTKQYTTWPSDDSYNTKMMKLLHIKTWEAQASFS